MSIDSTPPHSSPAPVDDFWARIHEAQAPRPIGPPLPSPRELEEGNFLGLLRDAATWTFAKPAADLARTLVKLAGMWRGMVRFSDIDKEHVPGRGLGHAAARHAFEQLALKGASEEQLTRFIVETRDHLYARAGKITAASPSERDTGFSGYFATLELGYSGNAWRRKTALRAMERIVQERRFAAKRVRARQEAAARARAQLTSPAAPPAPPPARPGRKREYDPKKDAVTWKTWEAHQSQPHAVIAQKCGVSIEELDKTLARHRAYRKRHGIK